jgi:hypothetical protein
MSLCRGRLSRPLTTGSRGSVESCEPCCSRLVIVLLACLCLLSLLCGARPPPSGTLVFSLLATFRAGWRCGIGEGMCGPGYGEWLGYRG